MLSLVINNLADFCKQEAIIETERLLIQYADSACAEPVTAKGQEFIKSSVLLVNNPYTEESSGPSISAKKTTTPAAKERGNDGTRVRKERAEGSNLGVGKHGERPLHGRGRIDSDEIINNTGY